MHFSFALLTTNAPVTAGVELPLEVESRSPYFPIAVVGLDEVQREKLTQSIQTRIFPPHANAPLHIFNHRQATVASPASPLPQRAPVLIFRFLTGQLRV